MHALFADMGGILLKAIRLPAACISRREEFIDMSHITDRDILDRDKADKLTPTVAVFQMVLFSI